MNGLRVPTKIGADRSTRDQRTVLDLVRDHINAVAVVQLRILDINIEMGGFKSLGQGWEPWDAHSACESVCLRENIFFWSFLKTSKHLI